MYFLICSRYYKLCTATEISQVARAYFYRSVFSRRLAFLISEEECLSSYTCLDTFRCSFRKVWMFKRLAGWIYECHFHQRKDYLAEEEKNFAKNKIRTRLKEKSEIGLEYRAQNDRRTLMAKNWPQISVILISWHRCACATNLTEPNEIMSMRIIIDFSEAARLIPSKNSTFITLSHAHRFESNANSVAIRNVIWKGNCCFENENDTTNEIPSPLHTNLCWIQTFLFARDRDTNITAKVRENKAVIQLLTKIRSLKMSIFYRKNLIFGTTVSFIVA